MVPIVISGLLLSLLILIPLSRKWGLEAKITIPAACLVGMLSGIVSGWFAKVWNLGVFTIITLEIFAIAVISLTLLLWRFYRDPERVPPEEDGIVLSPADGRVVYIKQIEEGQVLFSEKNGKKFSLSAFTQCDVFPKRGHLIGIALTYLDVHVNRAPVSGKIQLIKHIKGMFFSLKKKEAIVKNERALILIDNSHFKLGIVLIASRLVRNIVIYIHQGQKVRKGDRIGMIRFGSQADLVIPNLPSLRLCVRIGEKVTGGVSILARYDVSG